MAQPDIHHIGRIFAVYMAIDGVGKVADIHELSPGLAAIPDVDSRRAGQFGGVHPADDIGDHVRRCRVELVERTITVAGKDGLVTQARINRTAITAKERTAGRRVGKEGGSTCRFRMDKRTSKETIKM